MIRHRIVHRAVSRYLFLFSNSRTSSIVSGLFFWLSAFWLLPLPRNVRCPANAWLSADLFESDVPLVDSAVPVGYRVSEFTIWLCEVVLACRLTPWNGRALYSHDEKSRV